MASEHPALQNFSPTWEGIKHVAGKALKWAAIGAAVVGVLSMLPLGIGAGVVGFLGKLIGVGSVSGAMAAVVVPALQYGAIAGGILGAIAGVGGVFKGIDEAKQDAKFDYEQNQALNERSQLIARGRSQSFGPNSKADIGNPDFRGLGQNQGQGITR